MLYSVTFPHCVSLDDPQRTIKAEIKIVLNPIPAMEAETSGRDLHCVAAYGVSKYVCKQHTQTHTHIHTQAHTYKHTGTQTNTHTHTHTQALTHRYTHAHKHTHTNTHTHFPNTFKHGCHTQIHATHKHMQTPWPAHEM